MITGLSFDAATGCGEKKLSQRSAVPRDSNDGVKISRAVPLTVGREKKAKNNLDKLAVERYKKDVP